MLLEDKRLKIFLEQASYFLNFIKCKMIRNFIFFELVKAIEEKIEYGDLSKKNIEDIKKKYRRYKFKCY